IGAGTVGTALSVRLSSKGYRVIAVSSRSQTSAQNLARRVSGCLALNNNQDVADAAELIFITTPDDAIASVASEIQWHRGQSVVHCSGADSTDTLEPAKKLGAQVGAFHPLQTFAGVKQAIENIPGSTFAVEAEEPLLSTLKDMATALGGNWIELKASDKVIYHASAVIACNYMVTLVKLATDLWQSFAIPPHQATQALMPLLRGTLNNIDKLALVFYNQIDSKLPAIDRLGGELVKIGILNNISRLDQIRPRRQQLKRYFECPLWLCRRG
ncbi:unnamed protein product, partial [marine sediment metagenome]